MSIERQIEEMVRAVCIQMRDYPKLTCKKCKADNSSTNAYCRVQFEMERLYNAGYRKASEVAEEIFAEIEKIIDKHYNRHIFGVEDLSDVEQEAVMNFSGDVTYDIAELKKKYTEEGK